MPWQTPELLHKEPRLEAQPAELPLLRTAKPCGQLIAADMALLLRPGAVEAVVAGGDVEGCRRWLWC